MITSFYLLKNSFLSLLNIYFIASQSFSVKCVKNRLNTVFFVKILRYL